MRKATTLVAVGIGIALVVSGCQPSPTAPPLVEEPVEAASEELPTASAKGGKGKGGGGSGGGSAGVEMQGGMNGVSQQVPIQKDSSRELNLQGPYAASIDMTATWAGRPCDVLKGNPTPDEQEALLEKLLDPLQDRFRMVMVVDREGGDHRLTLNWDDGPSSPFEGLIVNVTDGVMVSEGPIDTFQFSGGRVRVVDKRGKVKDRVTLSCPNLDTITVVLDR